MAVVISDASPLICLSALRQLDLLRLLYGSVLPRSRLAGGQPLPSFTSSITPVAVADAKATGNIAAIEPLIKELIQNHNFRLHSSLIERILVEAGERS